MLRVKKDKRSLSSRIKAAFKKEEVPCPKCLGQQSTYIESVPPLLVIPHVSLNPTDEIPLKINVEVFGKIIDFALVLITLRSVVEGFNSSHFTNLFRLRGSDWFGFDGLKRPTTFYKGKLRTKD